MEMTKISMEFMHKSDIKNELYLNTYRTICDLIVLICRQDNQAQPPCDECHLEWQQPWWWWPDPQFLCAIPLDLLLLLPLLVKQDLLQVLHRSLRSREIKWRILNPARWWPRNGWMMYSWTSRPRLLIFEKWITKGLLCRHYVSFLIELGHCITLNSSEGPWSFRQRESSTSWSYTNRVW